MQVNPFQDGVDEGHEHNPVEGFAVLGLEQIQDWDEVLQLNPLEQSIQLTPFQYGLEEGH